MKTAAVPYPILVLCLAAWGNALLAQTPVSGTIAANTTWTVAGSPYELTGSVTVAAEATLAVEPGVVVRFAQSARLYVDGTLNAVGTALAPIRFTGTTETPNWWRHIRVRNAGSATLEHCDIAYAGVSSYSDPGQAGLWKTGSGALILADTTIRQSVASGLYIQDSTGASTLAGCSFRSNAVSGMVLNGAGEVTATGCLFADNAQYGVRQNAADTLVTAGNTFTGNGLASVGINGGTRLTNWHFHLAGSPFHLLADLTIGADATLTVDAGVTVAVAQNARFDVDGALHAVGTALAPIRFTGTTETPNWWRYIRVRNAGSATLEHCDIAHAGYYSYADPGSVGLWMLGSGDLTLRHSTIHDVQGDGLHVQNCTGTVTTEQSTFTGNARSGLQISGSQPTVTGCTFTGNSHYGIHQEAYNHLIDYASCALAGNALATVGVKGGSIATDPVWSPGTGAATALFRALLNVTVAASGSLTVQPGVTVEFTQHNGLYVDGALTAAGTQASPVTFTGTTEQKGWWRGIQLRDAGRAAIEHAVVACAGSSEGVGVLKPAHGSLVLANSTIRDISGDGVRLAAAPCASPQQGVDGDGDGYLWGFSPSDSLNSYFIASAAYHGDWRAYAELRLMLWSRHGTYYDDNGHASWRGDIYLANGDKFAHTMLDRDHSADWEAFAIQFGDPARVWTFGGGAASLDEVLQNVTAFHVRAEYGVGNTYAGLDNVELYPAGRSVPAIASCFPGPGLEGWSIDIGTAHNPDGIEGFGGFASSGNLFRNNTRGVRAGNNVSFDDATSDFLANGSQDVHLDGGTIERDVVWSLHRDYSLFVSVNVTVGAAARLRVLPGTVVKFAQNNGLTVDGVLAASGTGEAPIHFTDWRDDTLGGDANKDGDDTDPAPGGWRGIQVRNAGAATIEHVVLAYPGYSDTAGVLKSGSGRLTLADCTVRDTAGAGLRLSRSTGEHEIRRNTFTDNQVGAHLHFQAETVVLTQNRIEGNRDFGVRNQSSAEVDARGNWWGHLSGPLHGVLNPDGIGDTVSDGVRFDPWAITPGQGKILSPMRSGTLVAGDLLRLTGSELGAAGASYLWDFGDGRRATARNPGLVGFPAVGEFSVTYSATVGGEAPYPDGRHYTVVADTGHLPDLRVEALQVPATLAVGQVAQIRYTVRNVGQGPATGSWRDALYLSRDAYLDTTDRRLGSLAATWDLAVGDSYQNTLTIAMPTVEEGAYHLILVVNDEWTLLERHRLNNEQAAPVTAQVPALAAGVDFAVEYEAGRVEQYYRMTSPGGLNLLLQATGFGPALEVFIRFGALPTRSLHDRRLGGAGSLVLPAATAGDWYILVFGYASAAGDYGLRFDLTAVLLNRVSPTRHGTGTDLELALEGAGFFQPLSVELLAGGKTAYAAASVEVDSFTQAVARFPAGTLPAGTYTVQVGRDGHTATLPDAVQIVAGGTGRLETNLVLPASVGYNALATLYVEYANTGDATMPAPLLVLTGTQNGRQDAILTLEHHRLSRGVWANGMANGFAGSVQFLASGETPGLLQPGESRRTPVYYAGWMRPWDTSGGRPPIDWELSVVRTDEETPADWLALKAQMQPDTVRGDAWEVLWDSFTSLAGTTWGDYVAMLSRNALHLHRQGQRVENLDSLLAFCLRQAEGLSPLPVLAGGTDAALQAPGLPIVFSRSYLQPISRRFELGVLGRGWTHNWRHSLAVADDGTVSITDPTGTPRLFHPDSRYAGRYLAQAGDEGVLRAADGGFRLTEAAGGVQFYRDGKLEYIEDANANRISCTHAGGLLTRLEHSAGAALDLAYNAAGRLTSITDHLGRQTLYGYTGESLTSVQAPDGRTATYTYHTGAGARQHALTTIGLPDGTTRTYDYDERGRLVATWRDDRQEETVFAHHAPGRIDVTDALGNTSSVCFDHWARAVKTQNALGETVQTHFDPLGNLTGVTAPDGLTSTMVYDRRGNLVEVTDALHRTARFTYTRAGNRLAMVTDALNRQTAHTYDARGNLTAMVYPDGSRERWAYDVHGNPTLWTNRRGNAVAFTYDDAGRITEKTFQDGSRLIYRYDARGNLSQAEDARGITAFTYDTHDFLQRIDYPDGRHLAFAYDDAGRRLSSTDQLGYQLRYHHDTAGRLARLADDTGDLAQYAYDALGRLSRKTLGNGVYALHEYDAVGRLISLTNHLPDGSVLSRFAYTHDRRGRRTAMVTRYGTWTYGYDDSGQLVRAALASTDAAIPDQDLVYEYDALGNRVRTTVNGVEEGYAVNPLNQYTTVGDRTCTCDSDGNLVQEDGPDGVTVYTYNDENRLVGVTRGGEVWDYAYDALGNRVAVDANGATTHYVIDPLGLGNVVGEYAAGGALTARYTHGLGLVGRSAGAGSPSYYTFDPTGNTSELTEAAGAVQNAYVYQPFGGTLRQVQAAPNPFRFMGQFGVMAEATGLHHVRARPFDSRLGRFASADPIGFQAGDLNLQRYAFNDPVNLIDPSGEVVPFLLIGKGLLFAYGVYRAKCAIDDFDASFHNAVAKKEAFDRLSFEERTRQLQRTGGLLPHTKLGMQRAREPLIKAADAGYTVAKIVVTRSASYDAADLGKDVATGSWFFCAHNTVPPKRPAACPPGRPRRDGASGGRSPVDPKSDGGRAPSPCVPGLLGGSGSTRVIFSWDPNQKLGVAGFGAGNFVKPDQLLTYRIDFENYASATAPAQIVTIRDPLSGDLDWSTLELGEIGFGNVLIQVPPGLKYYQTVVDYAYTDDDYDFEIEVHVEAWLESGQLFFNFLSFDPVTGLPPPAHIGFLMPETDPATGRGRGFVSYLIRARPGLPSGTEIRNVATIQFDFSLEIDTNQVDPLDKTQGTDPAKEALVTFDGLAPVSRVEPLPAGTPTEAIPVSWSGDDGDRGSGIAGYDVYVRHNDGPWTAWLAATTETSALYPGAFRQTYAFYAVATDNVGHREEKAPGAEAATTVGYLLVYQASLGGRIEGDAGQVVAPGADGEPVLAVAEPGYRFLIWDDGFPDNPRQDLAVGADITATALFVREHTIVFLAGPGGALAGQANQVVLHGGNAEAVRAVPAVGSVFDAWLENGLPVSTDATLVVASVLADRTFTATFRAAGGVPATGNFLAQVDATTAAARGIWDLTGTYDTTVAGAPLTMNLIHDAKGKLTGTAVYTVATKDGKPATTVNLSVKGSVKGRAGEVLVAIALKGATADKTIRVALAFGLNLQAAAAQLVGTVSGSIKIHDLVTPATGAAVLTVPPPMDGTWALRLQTTQSGTAVTGTALLTLSNDAACLFVVKGRTAAGGGAVLSLEGHPSDPSARGLRLRTTVETREGGLAILRAFSAKGYYGQTKSW
jgi:RHS repeat-associated protein